jgi:hypothetical protein
MSQLIAEVLNKRVTWIRNVSQKVERLRELLTELEERILTSDFG